MSNTTTPAVGRELDEALARALGWTTEEVPIHVAGTVERKEGEAAGRGARLAWLVPAAHHARLGSRTSEAPRFSTCLATAFWLVDLVPHDLFVLSRDPSNRDDKTWGCSLYEPIRDEEDGSRVRDGEGPTAPEAIARAALAALGATP